MGSEQAEHVVLRSAAVFDLITQDRRVEVRVELRYDTRDPFAVTAAFRTGEAGWVEWVFARDLLADGLLSDVGAGDVQIRPGVQQPQTVTIELSSPSGEAVFEAAAQRLVEFLDSTYDVVAPGLETRWLGIEDAIDRVIT